MESMKMETCHMAEHYRENGENLRFFARADFTDPDVK